MHVFEIAMEWAVLAVDAVASLIMVWAFLIAVFAFVRLSFSSATVERIRQLQMVRCDLGMKLVFALELFIISDLLHTVINQTMKGLAFLGALVVIRTLIGFFLNREIQEVGAEISH